MANEFKHKDVGHELSEVEWEGTDSHEADSQAAGDILYCDGTYWKRLAKGANGLYLKAGSVPVWQAILEADIPASIARDAEVAADIATHAALESEHHTKFTTAEHDLVARHPLANLDPLVCSEAELATHTADKDAHHSNVADIAFIIDGGGSAITTGQKGHLEIPFACTINRVTTLADQSGSIVVDIWKDTYANFPPDNADSITASAPPTLSSAQKSQDSTLTGWTTAIAAGNILAYNVDSVATVQRVLISLKVTRT